ncbi:MAG: selenide, water dikinase SelD [Candidatus Cloacimonetes bacterium]|nr:selenide, water dikinase SelD [Candidatus Cloacimonadota bacterium]
MEKFDLLTTVENGGCSAKIAPDVLEKILGAVNFSFPADFDKSRLLVGLDTHDDAGVYKINDEQAIVFTTDFFPPMCSDAFTFGQIAAANALSDVYTMGGQVLLALNLIMFPDQKIPLSVLSDILQGGQSKVAEASAIIIGGHTIDDFPPKYGLAVIGMVHPDKVITNAKSQAGDVLILTKPIGTGVILAGNRLKMAEKRSYDVAIDQMKHLNKEAAILMNKYQVLSATDITGFGLLGHALKMAKASSVCLNIDTHKIPFIAGAEDLIDMGCIPNGCFRNQKYASEMCAVVEGIDYNKMMLCYDAQTSGGMLISVSESRSAELLQDLKQTYPHSEIIGTVTEYKDNLIKLVQKIL